jgi:hypothetical protein
VPSARSKTKHKKKEKGRRLLCLGEEDAKHILLDRSETKNWRPKFLNDKWLGIKQRISLQENVKMYE